MVKRSLFSHRLFNFCFKVKCQYSQLPYPPGRSHLNKKEDQKQTSALTIEDLFVLIYTLQLFPFLNLYSIVCLYFTKSKSSNANNNRQRCVTSQYLDTRIASHLYLSFHQTLLESLITSEDLIIFEVCLIF